MAKLSTLKLDPTSSVEGVWVDYVNGIRLRIARVGNDNFNSQVRLIAATKRVPQDEQQSITKEAVAKAVLVDWENIEDEDGEPIPYTWKQAYEWFNDPQLDDMYTFVLKIANQRAVFQAQAQQEDAGN